MSVITQADFHAIYGAGRGLCKGSPAYTTERDVRVLTALVDHFKARRCLEIGCNIGATSAAILNGNESIVEYIGLDLPKIWFRNEPAGHLALHDPRFVLMQLENGSHDFKALCIDRPDFIFIDGAHDYAAVKYDTELALSIIAPGGVIAWHDYQMPTNPDVAEYIHEINDKPGEPVIVWVKDTWVCYQITAEKRAASTEEKSDGQENERQSCGVLGNDPA